MTVPLLLERQDAVVILSINDAPYNRMTLEFIDELERQVDQIGQDSGIRAN